MRRLAKDPRQPADVPAVLLFVFNLVGLPTYAGMYDKFLIAVGLVGQRDDTPEGHLLRHATADQAAGAKVVLTV